MVPSSVARASATQDGSHGRRRQICGNAAKTWRPAQGACAVVCGSRRIWACSVRSAHCGTARRVRLRQPDAPNREPSIPGTTTPYTGERTRHPDAIPALPPSLPGSLAAIPSGRRGVPASLVATPRATPCTTTPHVTGGPAGPKLAPERGPSDSDKSLVTGGWIDQGRCRCAGTPTASGSARSCGGGR